MDPHEGLERIVAALERIAATLDPTGADAGGLPIDVLAALKVASEYEGEVGRVAREALRAHGYR